MTQPAPETPKSAGGFLVFALVALFAIGAFVLAACLTCALPARAQDMEPRIYSNAPVGMNFLIVGGARAEGGVSFDPSLPISDPDLRTNTAVVAYARVLDLWGHSGKIDAVLPYTWLEGTAIYRGDPVERVVDGPNDPAFRLSVLLYGAPALTALDEFAASRPPSVYWGPTRCRGRG